MAICDGCINTICVTVDGTVKAVKNHNTVILKHGSFHAFNNPSILLILKVSLEKVNQTVKYERVIIFPIQTSLQQDTLMFVSILAHRSTATHPEILNRLFCRVVNSGTGSRE